MTNNPWSISTRTIVLAAIFGALVVAMQIVGIGSIPVPNISGSMTTLHLPVIIGSIIGGPIVGLFSGLVMGVLYLTLPATAVFGPITLIVPRLLMALDAYFVYRVLSKNNKIVASGVAAFSGTLTNTVFAVGIAILLGQVPASAIPAILPQAIVEVIASTIIVPIIVTAVQSAMAARGN